MTATAHRFLSKELKLSVATFKSSGKKTNTAGVLY